MKLRVKNGFSILAVISVIVAVIEAIGLSGQSNANAGSSSNAKIKASGILNDSSSFKLALDTLVINGTHKDNITFALDNSATSVLNSETGISIPTVTSSALKDGLTASEGFYVLNKVVAPNITNDNNHHPTILLACIKSSFCEKLNESLYGTTQIPVYASFSEARQFTDGATKTSPTSTVNIDFKSNGLGSGNITEGWRQSCISGTNTVDSNLYFRILD